AIFSPGRGGCATVVHPTLTGRPGCTAVRNTVVGPAGLHLFQVPVIATEGNGRQGGFVVQRGNRGISPCVARRDRCGDRGRREDHRVAGNACGGRMEYAVVAGDLESLGRSLPCMKPGRVLEVHDELVPATLDSGEGWSLKNDSTSVNVGQGDAREPSANVLLVARVDVVGITDIDRDRLSRVRQLERFGLSVA